MAFLKAIFDVVNDVPHIAMVVVMIDSEKDPMALDATAQANRTEIEANLRSNGNPATVTSNTDFAAILRRRLFENQAPAEVISADDGHVRCSHQRSVAPEGVRRAPPDVTRPTSLRSRTLLPVPPIAHRSRRAGMGAHRGVPEGPVDDQDFRSDRLRSAQCGKSGQWAPSLIGPATCRCRLPRSASPSSVRASLLTVARKRTTGASPPPTLSATTSQTGAARLLDLAREVGADIQFVQSTLELPSAWQRRLFLYSVVGTRAQGRRGATEAELKAAAFVPDTRFR